MSRPPRSSSPADKRVSIRLTVDEHAACVKAADPATLSNWIRTTILDSACARPPSTPDLEALRQAAEAELARLREAAKSDEKVALVLEGITGMMNVYERALENQRVQIGLLNSLISLNQTA